MESTATPVKSARNNEISINNKHKFERSEDFGRANKNKILKRQTSVDVSFVDPKIDGTYMKNTGSQQTTDNINHKINGILHKTTVNTKNYNRVNKGIQANLNKETEQKRVKHITYSKSFDEATFVNKKTQTSLENINNPSARMLPSYSFDVSHHQTGRNNKLDRSTMNSSEQKVGTVVEDKPSHKNKRLTLELSREEQEQQSMNYQKQMMSALYRNKSITPTENEDKTFMANQCERSSYTKYARSNAECNKRIEKTQRTENSKEKNYSSQEQTVKGSVDVKRNLSKNEQSKIQMKKSYSMQNYSESNIENCSNQYNNNEKTNFRPTTKSFSFDLENRSRCETSNPKVKEDFVKISKPNCDILRKQSKQQCEVEANHCVKPIILHETKIKHPLEAEPLEAIIGQGFADDRRIQTPLILKQMNENNHNPRDYCYWTTRNSRKNSSSMISDEAIIGKGFLDDEEFIEFYTKKQTKPLHIPEELKPNVVDTKKVSPKFNLNKKEIKKYFLHHGNSNEPLRANIKSEQGVYEVPVKPIVKKVINANDKEPLHFNFNYEVPGEVLNKDQNNNCNNNRQEKLYGKRALKQNEYVELSSKTVDHHYEVLHNKQTMDQDKIYEAPVTKLDDDVFADELTVKHIGEDYMNTNTTKYRKSPMLWYINDQVISFHNDIPSIIANKKISLPVSSNIRPLGFPSASTSYYSMHNFDMHRQNPQAKSSENYTSMIRPLILG